jgi:hypothetical protein
MTSGNRHGRDWMASEFVRFIVVEGHTETLIFEHVRNIAGKCKACQKVWPCNWRRLGEQALELLLATA